MEGDKGNYREGRDESGGGDEARREVGIVYHSYAMQYCHLCNYYVMIQ